MGDADSQKGVKDCYPFKSRLQEYAQKVGFSSPVYQTVKEGPSHEPIFKSTVIVNEVKYESLPGFFNRKTAEQSAAEAALKELEKLDNTTKLMPTVHETGLCKNMLQEYAQKMNFAVPSYACTVQKMGNLPYCCTVDVGGVQYIGASARTKKEAEIKAARTALLAINSNSMGNGTNEAPRCAVNPDTEKEKESTPEGPSINLQPRKKELKKKKRARRFPGRKAPRLDSDINNESELTNCKAFFGIDRER